MSVFWEVLLAILGIRMTVEALSVVLLTMLFVIQDIKMTEEETNVSLQHCLVTLDIKMTEEEIKIVLLWQQTVILGIKTMVEVMFVS